MGLIVNEGILGERVLYKTEQPCMVAGFQETEVGGFPKVYFIIVNVCTGKLIKAEMDSITFLVSGDRCGFDGDYYRRCVDREILRHRLSPKIANILIDAGYTSMEAVEMNFHYIIDLKGIGKASADVISKQLKIWREDKGGVVNEIEENI